MILHHSLVQCHHISLQHTQTTYFQNHSRTALYYLKNGLILFVISVIASHPGLNQTFKRLAKRHAKAAVFINMGLLFLSIAYMVYNSYTPFLYMKF